MKSHVLAGLLLAGLGAEAAPLVAKDSQLAFTGSQMGVAVRGEFKRFSGDIVFFPEKLEASSARLRVDSGSIDIGIREGNATLQQADWFDASRFPDIEFHSRKFEALGQGRYAIDGELKLKGASLPLRIETAISKTAQGHWRAEAEFPLKRLPLKLGVGEWADTAMVADEVKVHAVLSVSAE